MGNFRILFMCCFFFHSCHSEEDFNLIRKWKVQESTIENNTLLPHQKLQLLEELKSMVIDLKDDGVIVYSNFYRLGAHGNWELNQSKDSLILNYQFERTIITDNYAFQMKEQKMHLVTTSFEGTKSVSLILIPYTE